MARRVNKKALRFPQQRKPEDGVEHFIYGVLLGAGALGAAGGSGDAGGTGDAGAWPPSVLVVSAGAASGTRILVMDDNDFGFRNHRRLAASRRRW